MNDLLNPKDFKCRDNYVLTLKATNHIKVDINQRPDNKACDTCACTWVYSKSKKCAACVSETNFNRRGATVKRKAAAKKVLEVWKLDGDHHAFMEQHCINSLTLTTVLYVQLYLGKPCKRCDGLRLKFKDSRGKNCCYSCNVKKQSEQVKTNQRGYNLLFAHYKRTPFQAVLPQTRAEWMLHDSQRKLYSAVNGGKDRALYEFSHAVAAAVHTAIIDDKKYTICGTLRPSNTSIQPIAENRASGIKYNPRLLEDERNWIDLDKNEPLPIMTYKDFKHKIEEWDLGKSFKAWERPSHWTDDDERENKLRVRKLAIEHSQRPPATLDEYYLMTALEHIEYLQDGFNVQSWDDTTLTLYALTNVLDDYETHDTDLTDDQVMTVREELARIVRYWLNNGRVDKNLITDKIPTYSITYPYEEYNPIIDGEVESYTKLINHNENNHNQTEIKTMSSTRSQYSECAIKLEKPAEVIIHQFSTAWYPRLNDASLRKYGFEWNTFGKLVRGRKGVLDVEQLTGEKGDVRRIAARLYFEQSSQLLGIPIETLIERAGLSNEDE